MSRYRNRANFEKVTEAHMENPYYYESVTDVVSCRNFASILWK